MSRQTYMALVACASMAFPFSSTFAENEIDLSQIQQELDQLKEKVVELESNTSTTTQSKSNNTFNPSISLILSGRAAYFTEDPENYSLTGFELDEEAGSGEQGFSLGESELTISSNIDNLFFGQMTFALTPENEAELEEAFVETQALPAGFTARMGRMKSGIGYLNRQHSHVWDFADAPLVYRAMFGDQYADDGIRLTWLAPRDFFLEFGTEAFRGESNPAAGATNKGTGTYTAYVHVGADVGISHSWQAGLSHLSSKAVERDLDGDLVSMIFSGENTINIADFVWKWAPNGNPADRNFKLQMEYLWGNETGTYDPEGDINVDRDGWYAQSIYQFKRGWKAGLRYGEVSSDDTGAAFNGTALDTSANEKARRGSVSLDFSNSEFSRIRLQVNRDESSAEKYNAIILQYVMALGAHGGHQF